MEIAFGDNDYWSFPSWPSHIDHILITDELFNETYNVQTLLIDEQFFNTTSQYVSFISDHRPLLIQFYVNP